LDDRELVRRLLAKDEEAQRHFYHTYRDKLYRASAMILGYQDPDAEDVVHEVFLAALKKMEGFRFEGSLYHWLYRICMYLSFDRVRKRRRHVAHLHEELDDLARGTAVERAREAEESGPREKVLTIIRTQKEALGEPCKELLELREEKTLSYGEISATLRIPLGTVMSRLARCRETWKARVLKAMKEERP